MAEQTTLETIEEKMVRLREEAEILKRELETEQERKMQLIKLYNEHNKENYTKLFHMKKTYGDYRLGKPMTAETNYLMETKVEMACDALHEATVHGEWHYVMIERDEAERLSLTKTIDWRRLVDKQPLYEPLNYHTTPHEALRFYYGIDHYVGDMMTKPDGTKRLPGSKPVMMAVKLRWDTIGPNFCCFNRHYYEHNKYLPDKQVLQLKEDEALTTTIFSFETADYNSLDETYKTTTDHGWDFTALIDYEDAVKEAKTTNHHDDDYIGEDDYMQDHDMIRKHYDPSGKSWPLASLMDYDPYELNKNLLNPECKLITTFDPFWVVRQSFVFKTTNQQKK